MPPRIALPPSARRCLAPSRPSPIDASTSLAGLLSRLSLGAAQPASATTTQRRHASILASLSDNEGAYNKRKRIGRGPASGYGKTSGRGHKGQGQHGKVRPWFQGGQTPLAIQRGRKGFENIRAPVMSEVNLSKIQEWITAGRLDPTQRIGIKELYASGLVNTVRDGVKILAGGKETLSTPLNLLVSRASASAIDAIEAAGGRIVCRYYTRQAIERIVRGESVETDRPLPLGAEHVAAELAARRAGPTKSYRLPDPTGRLDIEYYRDPAHRGYLSHLLREGESPSLYYRVPAAAKPAAKVSRAGKLAEDKDRLF